MSRVRFLQPAPNAHEINRNFAAGSSGCQTIVFRGRGYSTSKGVWTTPGSIRRSRRFALADISASTYLSAVMVRKLAAQHRISLTVLYVFYSRAHARRSRMLYHMAFGSRVGGGFVPPARTTLLKSTGGVRATCREGDRETTQALLDDSLFSSRFARLTGNVGRPEPRRGVSTNGARLTDPYNAPVYDVVMCRVLSLLGGPNAKALL